VLSRRPHANDPYLHGAILAQQDEAEINRLPWRSMLVTQGPTATGATMYEDI
jgi:hypothetical protein